jgi:hypothetical protein
MPSVNKKTSGPDPWAVELRSDGAAKSPLYRVAAGREMLGAPYVRLRFSDTAAPFISNLCSAIRAHDWTFCEIIGSDIRAKVTNRRYCDNMPHCGDVAGRLWCHNVENSRESRHSRIKNTYQFY